MFSRLFIRILRAWQKRHSLVALFIQSHGNHTETSVLLDETGSAYQYCRPRIQVLLSTAGYGL